MGVLSVPWGGLSAPFDVLSPAVAGLGVLSAPADAHSLFAHGLIRLMQVLN
jgi:hypothetical protein